jgi:dihydrofolate synthase / folylpolyglutamate synthase
LVISSRRYSTLEDWLAWLETLHPKKIDLSLDRVIEVLGKLELLDPPYKIVTVAGTNGKGSCVAMLESIYWHAGYDVGSFTSPHLWRFNERIRFNGEDAADEELIEHFQSIERALGAVTLSYFESSAIAALLHFARRKADVAILEVGMGGRLDAVNAVDTDCALIVSIDLDHQAWLGDDREAIGREKAGIMRRAAPVVIADRAPPASLLAHAAATGAATRLIGRDFDYVRSGNGWRPRAAEPDAPLLPRPYFGGDEQFANAAACATVVDCLMEQLPVTPNALADGIRHAYLRGRLERHRIDAIEWVFDVAHNPAATALFLSSLRHLPAADRTLAVFAAMHDKDLTGVLSPLVGLVDHWFVTQANADRGATARILNELLERLSAPAVSAEPDVAAACVAARAAAHGGDRVLVFGSFHTVGAATAALGLYCAPSRLGSRPAKWTRV